MTWSDFILRATLVLAAAFLASYAFARASAALRHFVWTTAFLALLLLPAALRIAPKFPLAIWPTTATPTTTTAAATPTTTTAAIPTPAQYSAGAPRILPTLTPYLALYLAGFLLVAARFAAGALRTSRLSRAARPADYAQHVADSLAHTLDIARSVRALESAAVAVPMTWGSIAPVVLLPESAREWPANRLHAVVLHELVHVRRHDLLAQMAAQAACCLYWFHPLVWIAARQLRKERESACDDAVLSIGVPAPDYAGHLLEMARALVARRSLADAPAMAEAGGLEDRVRAVLDSGRNRAPLNRRLAAMVATLAFALALPLTLVTLQAQGPTGALNGIVQDISRARVPGTTLQIKNLDGKNEEVGTVNPAGEFGFGALPPGRYSIEARARGFALGKTEITVESGRTVSAVITLPMGQITESVTVKGSRPATGSLAPAAQPPAAPTRVPQRIAVGGNVQVAKIIRQTRPIYPEDLKAQGISGTVILKAVISTTGEPLNPQVVNTAVNFGLAQAALDAVKQWRYQPTLLNGQPVEVTTTIQVTFELDQ